MSAPGTTHALLRPQIAIPFVIITLIWGSTWFAIKDQLDAAPPAWSVTWRFVLAAAGMFALALLRRESLAMPRPAHGVALAVGVTQFFLNYNFVYSAEVHLTSGLVAVLYALMIPINAILGALLLDQPVTRRFLFGSAIALSGTALLVMHEARIADLHGSVWIGLALTLGGIVCASIANVVQARKEAGTVPMATLLAWAMLYGAVLDGIWAFASAGPPQLPLDLRYLGGVAFLALLGSVATFPLYYNLIRQIGAGRAAYMNAAIPVVAMGISTLLEGYRWTSLAAGGAALSVIGLIVALRARNPARKVG